MLAHSHYNEDMVVLLFVDEGYNYLPITEPQLFADARTFCKDIGMLMFAPTSIEQQQQLIKYYPIVGLE